MQFINNNTELTIRSTPIANDEAFLLKTPSKTVTQPSTQND